MTTTDTPAYYTPPEITSKKELTLLCNRDDITVLDESGNDACAKIKKITNEAVWTIAQAWEPQVSKSAQNNWVEASAALGLTLVIAWLIAWKRDAILRLAKRTMKKTNNIERAYVYGDAPETTIITTGKYNPGVIIESIGDIIRWKKFSTDLTPEKKLEFWLERDTVRLKESETSLFQIVEWLNEVVEEVWVSVEVINRCNYILDALHLPKSIQEEGYDILTADTKNQLAILYWILSRFTHTTTPTQSPLSPAPGDTDSSEWTV